MSRRVTVVLFALALAGFGCSSMPDGRDPQLAAACPVPLSDFAQRSADKLYSRYCTEAQRGFAHPNSPAADPTQREKDTIFMLLTFALVTTSWDTGRGHQIAAVLVDRQGDRVAWVDFNSNYVNNSPLEHAEARALRNYIAQVNQEAADRGVRPPAFSQILQNITVYTSLEPCQMCAGTINMGRARRVVFGMKDDGFGDALDYDHAYPYHADFELQASTRTSAELAFLVSQRPGVGLTTIIEQSRYAFDYARSDLESYAVVNTAAQQALDNSLAALHAAGAK